MKAFRRLALISAASALATVLAAAFLSALPYPAGRISLGLIVACGLVGSFRPAEATAVIIGSGLVLDALSSSAPGMHLLSGGVSLLLADFVFRRLLANLNLLAFAVLNALAFTAYSLVLAGFALLSIRLSGLSVPISINDWTWRLISSGSVQVGLSLVGMWLFRLVLGWFRGRYLHSRYAHR